MSLSSNSIKINIKINPENADSLVHINNAYINNMDNDSQDQGIMHSSIIRKYTKIQPQYKQ